MLVESKIKEANAEIKKANFIINPKVIDKNNVGCSFCQFKDICYKKDKDTIYLDKVEDLSFLEEEVY